MVQPGLRSNGGVGVLNLIWRVQEIQENVKIHFGDKMIQNTKILLFALCAITLSIIASGCEKRMMEMIPPIEDPPSKTNIQRAREDMERVNQRRTESQENAEESGDYFTVFTDSEKILNEELGFRKAFWLVLVEIYIEENSENTPVIEAYNELQDVFIEKTGDGTLGMIYYEYIRTFDPLVIEYLRLSYVYPTHSEEALLKRFRKSIQDGKVSLIFPEDF